MTLPPDQQKSKEKLPNRQLSKEKLLDEAGDSDSAKIQLVKHIYAYGHDLDDLSFRIRRFFTDSTAHYDRLAFRDAIAACLGLDVRRPQERDALWEHVVKGGNPYRADGIKWKNGQEDMPLDELRDYARFCLSSESFRDPVWGGMMPVTRLAIARTLTYIRVLPPKSEKKRGDLPDGAYLPEELEACWKELRRHPHYRNSNPANLNQHALDSVADRYRERLWIEPHQIGALKRTVEKVPFDPSHMFWFWPFVVLKYATRCKIQSRNHNTINKFRSLWNPMQKGYLEVWA